MLPEGYEVSADILDMLARGVPLNISDFGFVVEGGEGQQEAAVTAAQQAEALQAEALQAAAQQAVALQAAAQQAAAQQAAAQQAAAQRAAALQARQAAAQYTNKPLFAPTAPRTIRYVH